MNIMAEIIVDNLENERRRIGLGKSPEPEPPPDEFRSFSPSTNGRTAKRWSVADLLDADFPEPRFAIPDIFPEGLTLLGGRPKVGKSWLMLQAAWSVGVGGRFFDREVELGKVLYLALEDSPRRLKDRIRAMAIPRDANIHFQTTWRPLHQGGLDDLIIELERGDLRMIEIDTLTRSIPGIDQKKDLGIIGRVIDQLQHLALNYRTSIVASDHTRKPNGIAADPIDDIIHSSEKTAIADAILALYKQQGKAGATLLGRGRDIEEIEYTLQWDILTRCWQLTGEHLTENEIAILDALETLGEWVQIGDIAKATGQNRGSIHVRLTKMESLGRVIKKAVSTNVYYKRI
jgi:AAA domain